MSTLNINNISPYTFPLPIIKGFNDVEKIKPSSESTQFELTKFDVNDLLRFYVVLDDGTTNEVEPAFLTETQIELDTAIDENDELFVFALKTNEFRTFKLDSVTIFEEDVLAPQTTDVTFTIPSGTESGDLIVLYVTHTQTISADNDTLRLDERVTTNENISLSLFRKICTASSSGQDIIISNPDGGTVQVHYYILRANRDIDVHDFDGKDQDSSPFNTIAVNTSKLDLVIAALATSSTNFESGSEILPPSLFTKTSTTNEKRFGVGHYYPTDSNETVDGEFTVPLVDSETDEQYCTINAAISFGLVNHDDGSLTLVVYDIFIVTDTGTIRKIDPTDGSEYWNDDTLSGDSGSNYAIDAKDGSVMVSTYDNFVILDSEDGSLVYDGTDADLNAALAYNIDNNLYVGKTTGDVDKYDVSSTGAVDTTFSISSSAIEILSVDADGNLYANIGDETISVDDTGTERFRVTDQSSHVVTDIAISESGNLFQCYDDRVVKGFDGTDGSELWDFVMEPETGDSGVAIFCDRRNVYVVTNMGRLLQLGLDNGVKTDTLTISNQVSDVTGEVPVSGYIGKNESVYVGYASGKVVEIDADKNASLVIDTTEANAHVAVESGKIGAGFWNV